MPPSGKVPVIRFPAIDSPMKHLLKSPKMRDRHSVTSGWAVWVLLLSLGIVVLLFGQLAIGRGVDYLNQEIEQQFVRGSRIQPTPQ